MVGRQTPAANPASAELLVPSAAGPWNRPEGRFETLVRTAAEHQWDHFPYYRQLCTRNHIARPDLAAITAEGSYHRLPSVVATAFKRSKGLIAELSDLSVPGSFQVSSSTSGDPSCVYTSDEDRAYVVGLYARTFIPAGATAGVAFGPSLRIMRRLSKRAALMGRSSVLRMQLGFEGVHARLPRVAVTIDADVPRTLLNLVLRRPAAVRRLPVSALAAFLREVEASGETIAVGGLSLLLRSYLEQFREGEFALHEKCHVAFSGGGYSGAKGTMRGAKIDKPAFIARIAAVFGVDRSLRATNVKDIYSFTETTAQVEGYWSDELDDFLFRPSPECRVYIVDPEDERPLRSGRGLIKIISPGASGRPASPGLSVLQFDTAEIVSTAPEGWVEAFTRVGRYEGAGARGAEGCAFKAAEIAGE